MKEKTLEEQVKDFEDYHGKKSYHIVGGMTEYPGTIQEKYYPSRIVKGPIKWNNCKLCNQPLREIKKDKPKKRLYKFCSDECRKEHDEIKKIRIKLNAETISWPPQKPPIPKKLLVYTLRGEEGEHHKYRARKLKN